MEQTLAATPDVHTVADALIAVADLIAQGRAVILADHWNISAFDFLHKAEDIAAAMNVTDSNDFTGSIGTLAGRRCRTVYGTLAGHWVRLTWTLDDLDWHGPKVGEVE